MAVYLGSQTINNFYLGSSALSSLYLGTNQLWPVNPLNPQALFIGGYTGSLATLQGKLTNSTIIAASHSIATGNTQATSSTAYQIAQVAFLGDLSITSYIDNGQCTSFQVNNNFRNCANLVSASFPGVGTAGSFTAANVFNSCSKLEFVNFPNIQTFTSFIQAGGAGWFQNCTSLPTISLPKFTSWLPSLTFSNCTSRQLEATLRLRNTFNCADDMLILALNTTQLIPSLLKMKEFLSNNYITYIII